MRVDVRGTSASADALRGLLTKSGCLITVQHPLMTITIEESEAEPGIVLDGVHGPMELECLNAIARLTKADIIIRRRMGTVFSDRELRVILRPRDDERQAIEEGLLSGLLRAMRPACPHCGQSPAREWWWTRWWTWWRHR